MADIYVRELEPDIKSKLEGLAASKKMSLNAFIKSILADYTRSPEIRSVDDKYKILVEEVASIYQNQLERMTEALEENTELLKRLIKGEE